MRYYPDAEKYLSMVDFDIKRTTRFHSGLKYMPVTLETALNFLNFGKTRQRRVISSNTTLYIENDIVYCDYYGTRLFHYEQDGVVFDYNGTYNSPSTGNRLEAVYHLNLYFTPSEGNIWGMFSKWSRSDRITHIPLVQGTKIFYCDGSIESTENYPEHHIYKVVTDIPNMVVISQVNRRGWKRAMETALKATHDMERVHVFTEVDNENTQYDRVIAQWVGHGDNVRRVTVYY